MERIKINIENFGKFTKDLRKKLKLNQSDFAEKCGYTAYAVSMVESGKREATMNYIKAVCNTYGYTMSLALEREETAHERMWE